MNILAESLMRSRRPEELVPERRAENITRISTRLRFLAVLLFFDADADAFGFRLMLLEYEKLHTISAATIPEARIMLMLATVMAIYRRLI